MFWFAGAVLGGGACVWRRDKPGSGFRSNSGTHVLAAARLGAAKGPPFLETLPVRTRPACGVIALPCLQLIPMPSEFCKNSLPAGGLRLYREGVEPSAAKGFRSHFPPPFQDLPCRKWNPFQILR